MSNIFSFSRPNVLYKNYCVRYEDRLRWNMVTESKSTVVIKKIKYSKPINIPEEKKISAGYSLD